MDVWETRPYNCLCQGKGRANAYLDRGSGVRVRAGRETGIFAFAHLTFQEYLAAQAVHEGNQLCIDVDRLINEYSDGRWDEVIALYCGIAPTPGARDMIERLIAQPGTPSLSAVLAEAYQAAGLELSKDHKLRRRVLERIAILPVAMPGHGVLERFPLDEVASITNKSIGKIEIRTNRFSESMRWLATHPELLDAACLLEQFRNWRKMTPQQLTELVFLLLLHSLDAVLIEVASDANLYSAPGSSPRMPQAEVALCALSLREFEKTTSLRGVDAVLLQILRTLSILKNFDADDLFITAFSEILEKRIQAPLPKDFSTWSEFISLSRRFGEHLANISDPYVNRERAIMVLNAWVKLLQRAMNRRTNNTQNLTQDRAPRTRPNGGRRKTSGGGND